MCGLAGFLHIASPISNGELGLLMTDMAATLAHRGPDDTGVWVDEKSGVALGFRRLAIVDLSPNGHQPMLSACGRYVLVFNGEIYNFKELRQKLEIKGYRFRSHSDTEVILAAIVEWGIEAAIKQMIGMFAIALWDRKEQQLSLIRDRIGEKPLYYGWMGDVFLFGSELKALRAHPAWHGEIERNALALYMRHHYIPAPYSIYQGIFKLLPGTILTLSPGDIPGQLPTPRQYWSACVAAEASLQKPFTGDIKEAIEELDALLRRTIAGQMIADVPLGAFLSGGVDSSTVVALMQAQSQQPVKTFTIGFHEADYDEANYAKAIANHLKTDHTELYVTPQDALAVIPRLATVYDEPFADSSQIPTCLVAQLARQHVKVSLSGDAGDELFSGYNRYFLVDKLWRQWGWLPQSVRRTLSQALMVLTPYQWDALHKYACLWGSGKLRQGISGQKIHQFAEMLAGESPELIYRGLVSDWQHPATLVLNSVEPPTVFTAPKQWANMPDTIQQLMYLDLLTFVPDDNLAKLDRAAMAVSLETRVPFLDHRVVEFAWRLPLNMKVRDGQSKWLLRQVLYRYVPPMLIERPKMGFSIPIRKWLRGPLRSWAEELLDERRLLNEGFFDASQVRTKWFEHLTCSGEWDWHLWNVLMFQAWLDEWTKV